MELQIVKAEEGDLPQVAALAKEIWEEHFTPIIGEKQVAYMVEKFQSLTAMRRQTKTQGYRYYRFLKDGVLIGYTGVAVNPSDEGRLFLSKLYLKKEERGQGVCSRAFDFLEDLCRKEGRRSIWLTVNKYNKIPLAVYQHRGFQITDSVVTDIGSGFVMDDYIMEKIIAKTK